MHQKTIITIKTKGIMKQIELENGMLMTFNVEVSEETAKEIQNFANFYFCKQHMNVKDEIINRWNVVPTITDPNAEPFTGVPTEEMIQEAGVFSDGRAWVDGNKIYSL